MKTLHAVAVMIALAALSGCGTSTPTPTATPTIVPAATVTAIPTPTPDPYPMRLEQVGQFGGYADVLALHGDMVYLKVGQRLVTVDVSDPTNPTIIGRSQFLPSGIVSVTVLDDYALVEDTDETLWMFEAPNTGDPILVRTFEKSDPERPKTKSLPHNVMTVGDYRFDLSEEFRLGIDAFLHIYDQSVAYDFQADKALEPLPDGETYAAANLIVRGHLAYAAAFFGLEIYDLSIDPEFVVTAPVEGWGVYEWRQVGTLGTDIGTLATGCCLGIYGGELFVVGDYLYTFARTQIFVWGLDNPADPVLIKTMERPYAVSTSFVMGEKDAILLSKYAKKGILSVLDTTNPADPVVRQVRLDAYSGQIGAIDGDTLFYHVTKEEDQHDGPFELHVLTIADLYHPQLISTYLPIPQEYYGRYEVFERFLHIRPGQGEEIVLDISDLSNLRPVTDHALPLQPVASMVSVGNWLIALEHNHFRVYKPDDLSTPIAEITTPTNSGPNISFHYLKVLDGLAFVSTFLQDKDVYSLTIIDIHDPEHPTVVAQEALDAYQMVAYKDVLYLHLGYDGIGVFRLVPN